MNEKLISIIVPVYNVEKYLPCCIESILNQSYKNFELICVDDGSSDNSLSILKRYESSDKRIKVINQSNRGVSVARNAGLRSANGDYIAFIDADDYVSDCYLSSLVKATSTTKADIIVCDSLTVYGDAPHYRKL